MAKTTRLLAIGMAVMAATSILARQAQAQDLAVSLNLQDHAGIPAGVLGDAQAYVTAIFEHAGVRTVWQAPAQFTIVILSAEMAAHLPQVADRVGVDLIRARLTSR